jgi:hypothetical protein
MKERLSGLAQSPLGSRLVLEPAVRSAYRRYLHTDSTPRWGYSAMRKLFGSPRSHAIDELMERAAREHPRLDLERASGVITRPTGPIVDQLRRDGLVVLDDRLPEQTCAALQQLAEQVGCRLRDGRPGMPTMARFDPDSPMAVRYDIPEQDILRLEVAQELLGDRSLLSIAQDYLGSAPVQDLVAMWWTTPSATGSSQAAQQFHFDLDRLRFLKMFAYLTDVGPDNGPHEFVRGSHRGLPVALRADRRFTDDEVLRHYDKTAIESVTGRRGTMFLADTRGLHKGLNARAGHRLVFQMEFATSLFGAPVSRFDVPVRSSALRDARASFPSTYRRLGVDT